MRKGTLKARTQLAFQQGGFSFTCPKKGALFSTSYNSGKRGEKLTASRLADQHHLRYFSFSPGITVHTYLLLNGVVDSLCFFLQLEAGNSLSSCFISWRLHQIVERIRRIWQENHCFQPHRGCDIRRGSLTFTNRSKFQLNRPFGELELITSLFLMPNNNFSIKRIILLGFALYIAIRRP